MSKESVGIGTIWIGGKIMKLNELKEKVVPQKNKLYEQILQQGLTEEEKELFNELKLNEPQEVVKFVINSFWTELLNINNKIYDLQEMELSKTLSNVYNAKAILKNKYESYTQQKESYNLVYHDLQKSLYDMMDMNKTYANNIMQIDNWTKGEALLHFKSGYNDSIKYSYLARASIEGIISGITLVYTLAKFLRIDISEAIGNDFRDFLATFWIRDEKYKIMGKYDINSVEFWNIVPQKAYEKISADNKIFSYDIESEIKEINLENIDWDNIEF